MRNRQGLPTIEADDMLGDSAVWNHPQLCFLSEIGLWGVTTKPHYVTM
jgi:hypothetical protein